MIATEPENVAPRFQFSLKNLLLFPASFAIAIGFVHAVGDLAFHAMYPIFGDDWIQRGLNALVAVGFPKPFVVAQLVFVLLDVPGLVVVMVLAFFLGVLKRGWSD